MHLNAAGAATACAASRRKSGIRTMGAPMMPWCADKKIPGGTPPGKATHRLAPAPGGENREAILLPREKRYPTCAGRIGRLGERFLTPQDVDHPHLHAPLLAIADHGELGR